METSSRPAATAAVLPNEIWIEIFENINPAELLKISLVCKHWHRLIFKYLAHRFQFNLDTEENKLPLRGTKMVPERNYKHLHMTSFALDSPPKLMTIFKQLAPNLKSLKLSLESLDFSALIRMLKLCPRLSELCIKGDVMVMDRMFLMELIKLAAEIINADTSLDLDYKLRIFDKTYLPCNMHNLDLLALVLPRTTFPTITSLGLDINYLPEFGRAFLPFMSNVTQLEIVLHHPDLSLVESLAPRLKILKVKVHQDAIDNFFMLRLPALKVLVLKLNALFDSNDLKQFLLGCTALKTAVFAFPGNEDLIASIAEGLPLVERLQISGDTETDLQGLQKMTHLKELALKGCFAQAPYFYCMTDLVPTVEKLECIGVMFHGRVGDVIERFCNVRSLTLSVRNVFDMSYFSDSLHRLKEFTVIIDRIYPIFIYYLEYMTNLEKLVIKAKAFAKSHFPLLQKVIVMPKLRTLVVHVRKGRIPIKVARKVASANRTCMLVLNGKRMEPMDSVRRVVTVKRKLRLTRAKKAAN